MTLMGSRPLSMDRFIASALLSRNLSRGKRSTSEIMVFLLISSGAQQAVILFCVAAVAVLGQDAVSLCRVPSDSALWKGSAE